MSSTRYRDIEMSQHFVLECLTDTGAWIEWGHYASSSFDRLDDGTYLCSGHGGSPLYLRCLRQEGDVIYAVDGGGDPFTYRMRPLATVDRATTATDTPSMANPAAEPVPFTPIYAQFKKLKKAKQSVRIDLARSLSPAELAAKFAASVEAFESYDRVGPFRPAPKFPELSNESSTIASSTDFAWYVHNSKGITVTDLPDLSGAYLDYEPSIIRSLGNARFNDEANSKAGGPLRPDLLLVNGGTPVVGEVKIGSDEPFTAIVQLLAYVAHLVTGSQYQRLLDNYPDAGLVTGGVPQVDAYLILHRFGEANATYCDEFLALAARLSDGLMHQPEITRHIARIACLDATLDSAGRMVASTRWLHERQGH